MQGEWGYAPMATSNYSWGTAAIFESDCWAPPPTTVDVCPYPTTKQGSAEFFERTSTMLSDAFTHAKSVGVQSCVGTETPLSKPAPADERAAAPSTQDFYEGMFTRLKKKVPALDWYWIWTPEGWEWGHMNAQNKVFSDAIDDLTAAMAAHDKVNPELKMATNGWVVGPLPDRSIFDKELPTTWDAITSIDLNTGHSPVDPSYKNVTRHKKWAIPWMEDDPDLSAPQLWVNRTLEHMEDAKAYGCNGLLGIHWRTHAVGPQIAAMGQKSWNFELTSKDFWADWAKASFGAAAAPEIAPIFESVDSFLMPLVVSWAGGPGKMHADPKACGLKDSKFAFVAKLKAAGAKVSGEANKARFDYWLATFQYMLAVSDTNCAWAEFEAAMKDKTAAKSKGLPARIALVKNATAMISQLQQTLTNVGELGTYMNIESHSLLEALDTKALEQALGEPLPDAAMPPKTYSSDMSGRLIIPTVRTTADKGSKLPLRALVLAASPCESVTIMIQKLGQGQEQTAVPMTKVAREVYSVELPEQSADFEYYVSAVCGTEKLVFPAGAPAIQQSVVLL